MALLLMLLAARPVCAAVTVNYASFGHGPDHPRFFVHEDELARIRSLATTPGTLNYTYFNQWKAHADYWLFRPDALGTNFKTGMYLDDIAALYLITKTPAYGDSAARIATYLAQNNEEMNGFIGSAAGRLSSVAIAYDWCYDRFTDAQRTIVRNKLAEAAQNNQSGWHHYYYYLDEATAWDQSLAIVEDASTYGSITNAQVRGFFEAWVNDFKDGFCRCLDVLTPQAYTEYYPANSHNDMVLFVRSIRGMSDWDPMSPISVADLSHTWTARFLPDEEWQRTLMKYNYSDADPFFMFSVFGSRWNDPVSQAIIETIDNSYSGVNQTSLYSGSNLYLYFLFHDPAKPAASLASLTPMQRDYYDPGAGVYMGRTGFGFGPGVEDLTLGFFCGPFPFPTLSSGFSGYDSKSVGHFYVSRGDDPLLCGSGAYYSETSGHWGVYYSTAIANNSILIQDPSQPPVSFNDCHNHSTDFQITNMGTQDWGSLTEGAARWPECADANGPLFKGEITKFVNNEDYVWIEGDMSRAYNTRASSVIRRWLYLRPNWILIEDRIVLSTPTSGDTIRVLFHCVDRPIVDGDSTLIAGTFAHGGVFRKTNATRAIINRDESSARVYFLGVQGGTATQVRVVGGTNSVGRGWQQSYDSANSGDPYGSYSPGDTSFEFFAGGKNLVPMWVDCTVRAGYYDVRNTAPYGGGGRMNPACDWRLEYLTRAAGQVITAAELIHVTSAGSQVLPVTPAWEGDTLRVGFTDEQGQEKSIALCPPGTECSEMHWTH